MKPLLWFPLMTFGGTVAILIVDSIYNKIRLSQFKTSLKALTERQPETVLKRIRRAF